MVTRKSALHSSKLHLKVGREMGRQCGYTLQLLSYIHVQGVKSCVVVVIHTKITRSLDILASDQYCQDVEIAK